MTTCLAAGSATFIALILGAVLVAVVGVITLYNGFVARQFRCDNAGSDIDVQEAAAAAGMLTGTLKHLFALTEAYPQLCPSDQFTGLRELLASCKDALQSAGRYYNAAVWDLNETVRMVPQLHGRHRRRKRGRSSNWPTPRSIRFPW